MSKDDLYVPARSGISRLWRDIRVVALVGAGFYAGHFHGLVSAGKPPSSSIVQAANADDTTHYAPVPAPMHTFGVPPNYVLNVLPTKTGGGLRNAH